MNIPDYDHTSLRQDAAALGLLIDSIESIINEMHSSERDVPLSELQTLADMLATTVAIMHRQLRAAPSLNQHWIWLQTQVSNDMLTAQKAEEVSRAYFIQQKEELELYHDYRSILRSIRDLLHDESTP